MKLQYINSIASNKRCCRKLGLAILVPSVFFCSTSIPMADTPRLILCLPQAQASPLVSVLTSTNDLCVSSTRLADGSTCHTRLDPPQNPP